LAAKKLAWLSLLALFDVLAFTARREAERLEHLHRCRSVSRRSPILYIDAGSVEFTRTERKRLPAIVDTCGRLGECGGR
jgi:hypothetical protein